MFVQHAFIKLYRFLWFFTRGSMPSVGGCTMCWLRLLWLLRLLLWLLLLMLRLLLLLLLLVLFLTIEPIQRGGLRLLP